MKAKMRKWVEKNWGKRCKDYAGGCPCCDAWASFDYLFDISTPLPSKRKPTDDAFLGGVPVFSKITTHSTPCLVGCDCSWCMNLRGLLRAKQRVVKT